MSGRTSLSTRTGTYSRLTRSMTPLSEYVVSSITWHQWHQTAEIESRIGLSSLVARSKAASDQGCQLISPARLGRGEKWNSALTQPSLRRAGRPTRPGRGPTGFPPPSRGRVRERGSRPHRVHGAVAPSDLQSLADGPCDEALGLAGGLLDARALRQPGRDGRRGGAAGAVRVPGGHPRA